MKLQNITEVDLEVQVGKKLITVKAGEVFEVESKKEADLIRAHDPVHIGLVTKK